MLFVGAALRKAKIQRDMHFNVFKYCDFTSLHIRCIENMLYTAVLFMQR